MIRVGKKAAIAAGAYFGYKAIQGFGGEVAPAMTSAAMDIAFDDPEADRAVLGTDLTPSMAIMASGIPVASQVARTRNLGRTGYNTGAVGAAAGIGVATGIGVAGGRRFMGGLRGSIIGGAIGAAVGVAGVIDNTVGVARKNSQIMSQSPFYNQSLLTADSLNVTGNILFVIYNCRRV